MGATHEGGIHLLMFPWLPTSKIEVHSSSANRIIAGAQLARKQNQLQYLHPLKLKYVLPGCEFILDASIFHIPDFMDVIPDFMDKFNTF